jgi:rhodanese-related sulfurtransferase
MNRGLGATALALGVAAPFAGSPERAPVLDIAALARAIADKQDHVSALQLARWIRDGKAGLRVIDVRTPAEFVRFALPTAENLPVGRLAQARFAANETIVLYSEGGAHAAQAWVLLKAAGVHHVYFVAGGLGDWFDEVMEPVLPADADARARARFVEAAALSRYFGGSPREALPGETVHPAADETIVTLAERARRRGC